MDSCSFDVLARAMARPSRRKVLPALANLAVGSLGLGREQRAVAKRCDPCRKEKRGTCMKKRPDGKPCGAFGACRNGRCVEPVCAGQNACANSGAPKCSAGETECFCFLTAATGKPFCGQNAHQAATCDACAKPAVCITTGALCPFSAVCALPCSDPR